MSIRFFVRLIHLLAILSICFAATGTVNWFNEAKGFGFIKPDGGGSDVFVHFSEIRTEGRKTLAQNQRVSFDIIQGTKGPTAKDVTII